MFTRVLMMGVLGVGLVATLGGRAEAHLAGTAVINGYVRHVASLECGINIKGVASTTQHPAQFQCTATITLAEFLCENPTNHQVTPGQSARRVVIVGEDTFNAAAITKKKGIVTAQAHLDTGGEVIVTDADCVNPNWHAIQESVLISEVSVLLQTFECGPNSTTETCVDPLVLAYQENLACVLPPGFGHGKKEVVPPENTEYNCSVISKEHVQ